MRVGRVQTKIDWQSQHGKEPYRATGQSASTDRKSGRQGGWQVDSHAQARAMTHLQQR